MSKLEGLEGVMKNLGKWQAGCLDKAEVAMGRMGVELENRAKANRPWVDRTGNARRSIGSKTERTPEQISTGIGIGIEYGVYLELSNGGKYRVIGPTVDSERSQFLDRLRSVL